MTRYTVTVPPTHDQGSTRFNITVSNSGLTRSGEALDTYNRIRAHDGQTPLRRMPAGTTYARHDGDTP